MMVLAMRAPAAACVYGREPRGDAFAAFGTCWARDLADADGLAGVGLTEVDAVEGGTGAPSGIGPLDQLPLLWVGGSFSGHPPAEGGPWRGWPAAWVRVPRWLAYRAGGRAGLVGHALVEEGADFESAADRLAAELLELAAELEGFVGSGGPGLEAAEEPGAASWERTGGGACGSDRRAFEALVAAARARVRGGYEEKLVVAREVAYALPEGWVFDPWATLERLARHDPEAFRFACRLSEDGGTLVGATPELLVRVRGRQVETHALAGTSAPDGDGLLRSEKDACEHRLTLVAIRAALEEVCSELEVEASPHVKRLARMEHLESGVRGTLREPTGVLELVRRLHPTPAVGGWPRAAALRWLAEHEPLERGYYAGPVGWVSATGDGVFAVAIRSGLLKGARAWAYAGAGIVADSEPRAEWEETELKLQTMERALSAAPGPPAPDTG
jgi:isochorismate synthase